MARTVRDENIGSRNARLSLTPRRKPYFRAIAQGLHLGYRRNRTGNGSWVARRYLGGERYETEVIAQADDYRDANSLDVLTFTDAQRAAARWHDKRLRADLGISDPGRPYTVADACSDYLAWYREHRRAFSATKSALEVHILPELGRLDASKLTSKRIRDWHQKLAASSRRTRAKTGHSAGQGSDATPRNEDAARARRATANRILTILKAALNHAYREGKVPSDDAWRRAKAFRGADAARMRYLGEEEARRLLNACPPAFRRLVRAALESGCRYGELIRLKVHDFHPDAPSLHIVDAKSGRPRHVPLDRQAGAFFVGVCAGRPGSETMLLRDDGAPWGSSHQQRPLAAACQAARIEPPVTFHGLRHTWASQRIMRGLPVMVAAQVLGHSDTRMVERHYGHLARGYVQQAIERTGMVLGDEPSPALPFRAAG
jgi:integrase